MNLRGGILALDVALSTGWCFGLPGARPVMGTQRIGNLGGNGEAGCAMTEWMANQITVLDPGLVLFEAPLVRGQHSGVQAGRLLLGLPFVVETVCFFRDVPCREAHVGTVRKDVLGRGNATKADVGAWCRAQGWNPNSPDAADAAAVWMHACKNHQHVARAA